MFCGLMCQGNVTWALEKNAYSAAIEQNVLLHLIKFIVLFKSSVSLMIFCLAVPSIFKVRYWCSQLLLNWLFLFPLCQYLTYVFQGCFRCTQVCNCYIFLKDWPFWFRFAYIFFHPLLPTLISESIVECILIHSANLCLLTESWILLNRYLLVYHFNVFIIIFIIFFKWLHYNYN